MPSSLPTTSADRSAAGSELLRKYPPPPVLLEQSTEVSPEVVAMMSHWEHWMVCCNTYAQYRERSPPLSAPGLPACYPHTARGASNQHPFLLAQDVQARLDLLWLHHRSTWNGP
eukprot:2826913-Amphidinium_carterae.1